MTNGSKTPRRVDTLAFRPARWRGLVWAETPNDGVLPGTVLWDCKVSPEKVWLSLDTGTGLATYLVERGKAWRR